MRTLVHQSFTPTPNGLACDDVGVESIVEAVGTPTYIYSARAIREAYRAIDAAFAALPARDPLRAEGELHARDRPAAAIARQPGRCELRRRDPGGAARRLRRLARSSSPASARRARSSSTRSRAGIGVINAESAGELDRIAALASARGREARVALRVNPDIDAGSHPNISTGLRINKFGVPLQDARAIYRERRGRPGLRFVGVHVHIGSQITTAEPLRRAARTLATLAPELRDDGFALEHLDVGRRARHRLRRAADRRSVGLCGRGDSRAAAQRPAGAARARPVDRRPCRRARGPRRGHQALSRRPPVRRARRRHGGADSARAVRVVPPHRAGAAARRRRELLGHRRPDLREQRRLCAGPTDAAARSRRISWRSSTPARTDR